jgi:aryl-alcohol dehydrogenase-like predicted oxidoreductase
MSSATIPKPFPKRTLGNSGEKVSAIGFGAMGLSDFYGTTLPDEESLKVLNEAIDSGATFIDTSDAYGPKSHNETLISKILKERRDEVFICTKFAFMRGENGEWLGISGKPEFVRQQCEASLKRLGVDTIDLYYQHRVDPNTPIEETVGAMAELVKEGKVRYLGLSECSAETLRRACKVHPIAALQIEYSPFCTDIETNGILEACRENNVAIVAYSPLGRGFLTGRFKKVEDFEENDFRRHSPRFQGENFAKNYKLVEKIQELAKQKGVTAGQLTLAWVMAQGDDFIPIPGTKSIKYLHENNAAASVTLSVEEVKTIRQMIDSIEIVGDRYPSAFMSMVNI